METYLPPNRQLSRTIMALPGKEEWDQSSSDAWLASQMHMAGCLVARHKANGAVETTAINELLFHGTIQLGDEVKCYAEIVSIYRTSFTVHVETWVRREPLSEDTKMADGTFTFIAKINNFIQ